MRTIALFFFLRSLFFVLLSIFLLQAFMSAPKKYKAKADWKTWLLRCAAVHCLAWGVFIIVAPSKSAVVYGFDEPLTDEFLWSGTGLTICLFGLGYGIASLDRRRHVAPVLIGLIAKILGPAGMMMSVWHGEIPTRVLYLLPFNDLLWWIPLTIIVCDGFHPPPKQRAEDEANVSSEQPAPDAATIS